MGLCARRCRTLGSQLFLFRLDLSLRVAIGAALMTAVGVFPEIRSLFDFAYLSRDIAWGPVVVCFTLASTMGQTVQVGYQTILGVSLPCLLLWIGERLVTGTLGYVLFTLFSTFMLAFLPVGDQLKRWSIAYTIVFFWIKIRGDDMYRVNGVAGLQSVTIATLAVFVCLLLSVVPFPRMARSAARVELSSLTDAFVELLEPLSDAFCDPLRNGHLRKKVTRSTQRTFDNLAGIEQHLADAWYEPSCFHPLRRGRLIVFAEHMRMCLRSLHILINLRNQRVPHKATIRFKNEWRGVGQALADTMRLLADYACGRTADDVALDVSIGSLRGAMAAWHKERSTRIMEEDLQSRTSVADTVDGATPRTSTVTHTQSQHTRMHI
jgi:hypothetical protein